MNTVNAGETYIVFKKSNIKGYILNLGDYIHVEYVYHLPSTKLVDINVNSNGSVIQLTYVDINDLDFNAIALMSQNSITRATIGNISITSTIDPTYTVDKQENYLSIDLDFEDYECWSKDFYTKVREAL